jgi:hypothetical protein
MPGKKTPMRNFSRQNVRMTMEELKATHQTPHVKERADGWRGSDVIEHAAGHSGT